MKRLARKLRTASSFSLQDWKILFTAYGFLLKTKLLLLFSSSRQVERALTRGRAGFNLPDDKKKKLPRLSKTRLLQLFQIAWRYQPGRPNCLLTSLAQQALLAHFGFPAELRIGVRKEKGRLEAHAWLNDSVSSGFETVEPLQPGVVDLLT